MIRVLIADDHALIRDSLQTIIDLQDDMEVAGLAKNGLEAYESVRSLNPDIVLMDIQMPEMDGIESTAKIKQDFPDMVVIVLTTFPEDNYIIEALVKGANGFLVKNMSAIKIIESIRDALSGQLMLPADVAAKLATRLSYLSTAKASAMDTDRFHEDNIEFTEREKQIILLMIEGKTNREISGILFMSEGTIKNYITVIYQKVGTNDRTKAVLMLSEMLKE